MRRLYFSILIYLILNAAMLQAQRAGGESRGGAGGGGFHGGLGRGGNGVEIGPRPGVFPGNGFSHGFGRFHYRFPYETVWLPYWGYWDALDWGWDYVNFPPTQNAPDSYLPPEGQASPPVIAMRGREPAPPVEPPKVLEVPLPKDASAPKQLPPALFVLADGEKFESRRYVVSADSLRIQIGVRQRTIALSALDIDATIAANRERGIDLIIPQEPHSLFLGF
jgi:hypothetical protein